MKQFFAYIRVSTAKQGERGVSLQEQRTAIERHAAQHQLQIAEWFEERETAAKRGRPVFNQMLRLLKQGKAEGIIIHKIDRSARNLRDWADLGEMIDGGIEVHFASESLDMNSRGGRLSADIQAVVAADFIRNLREETRKGFYGRLKQGLYPLPAPIGYLDRGKGNVKQPDPVSAPLVQQAFALYATEKYNLEELGNEIYQKGLRNRRGTRLSKSAISRMLNCPFYIGIIRLHRTGETFPGIHEPLVATHTFNQVHDILIGKTHRKIDRHEFGFRRMLRCNECGQLLTGELQKGHIYYRCHPKGCAAVREEAIEAAILDSLKPLVFSAEEKAQFAVALENVTADWAKGCEEGRRSLVLRLAKTKDRIERLTDAYVDKELDKELFEARKSSLFMERRKIEEELASLKGWNASGPDRLQKFFELAESAYLLYQNANSEEKRDLIKTVTSNRRVTVKKVEITLAEPFRLIADRQKTAYSTPSRDTLRTTSHLLGELVKFCSSMETRR